MSLVQNTFNYTITIVIMATSIFSAAFFLILFFLNRAKGILMIFLSNVLQITITGFLLIQASTSNEWSLVFANIISVLLTVFWINAIFIIYKIKISSLVLIAINSTGTFLALFLYSVFKNIHMVNVSSAFIVSAIAFYGAINASHQESNEKCPQKNYSAFIMFVFGALNIVRGLYRMFNPLDFSDFNLIGKSAAAFILICYGFSFLVNYSVLYLNYDELVKKVEKLSYIDKLTGALSRNTFFVILAQKLAEAKRCMRGICVAFLDIDNFKQVNDKYGHIVGDEVLKYFVKSLKDNLRENDVIGRYGGEEFVLIMEAESCEAAVNALERLRKKMKSEKFIADEKITFSCGHIYIDDKNCDMPIDCIIKAIDFKMYEAKAMGKDRVV